jgi:hypothetical protein
MAIASGLQMSQSSFPKKGTDAMLQGRRALQSINQQLQLWLQAPPSKPHSDRLKPGIQTSSNSTQLCGMLSIGKQWLLDERNAARTRKKDCPYDKSVPN